MPMAQDSQTSPLANTRMELGDFLSVFSAIIWRALGVISGWCLPPARVVMVSVRRRRGMSVIFLVMAVFRLWLVIGLKGGVVILSYY